MKSLNNCVQEFLDHHAPRLFPSDNTADTRRPRISRFNSVPSSSIDIEDEDPNLFVITPPIERLLDVSSRICREQFFKLICPGHILICHVLTASTRDMLVRILCFDDGHRRALHDLKLTATCSLNTSNAKNNNHRRSKYERDVQELSDEDNDDGEYQSGDFIRACVSHVDIHKEEIQLTMDPSINQRHPSSKKLGLINEDDLPPHYVLLRRQEEQSQSYEDILQTTKSFTNRACVQTLYQRLKKRFEYFHSEDSHSEPSNDILHMTLINSFKRKQIPSDEYFDKLREKQDHQWAIESVAQGVRLMKENDTNSAVLHFNKALATDPKCVDALVARGALSANQGHYKRAMQDFEDALKIDHKHVNAAKYLHDVLNNIAHDTDDYDDAIYYLEKALKYKPDDNETKRKLDALRTKKKEAIRKLEYGPNLPSNLKPRRSSKDKHSSKSSRRRKSSLNGSSTTDNGSKRKRSSSSTSSSSSSRSSSSTSSSSSSSSSTNHSLQTISSSSSSLSVTKTKEKTIPMIDITESNTSTTTQKSENSTKRKSTVNETSMISKISRSHSNDHSSQQNHTVEQRKSLPSASSSIKQQQQPSTQGSSSSTKKITALVADREAEDIEKLYMALKAKQSMEKRKK